MNAPVPGARPFALRWILASALGWLLGFVLVVVMAVALEAFAGGAQVVVGLGMGAGVGTVQGFWLRRWLGTPWPWAAANAAGMTLPFLFQDLVSATGLSVPSSLWLYVPPGALIVALLQVRTLRRVSGAPSRWIVPCLAGWTIPALLIAAGDGIELLGVAGGFLSLGSMLLGGVPLGAVTAGTLRSLLPDSEPSRH